MEEKQAKKPMKRPARKKVCAFCGKEAGIDYKKQKIIFDITQLDYKDVHKLRKYVAENGKILPRRMTGVCAQHQRALAGAIKNARIVALLPFKGE